VREREKEKERKREGDGERMRMRALSRTFSFKTSKVTNHSGFRSELHTAASSGNLGEVRNQIKSKGVNVNVQEEDGWTALHCASINGKSSFSSPL
jgi:ankyrin repeat protein